MRFRPQYEINGFEYHKIGAIFLTSSIFLFSILRIVNLIRGVNSIGPDNPTWSNVAQAVINGSALYLEAPDNKPPIFQFIYIIAEYLPSTDVLLLLAVGIALSIYLWTTYSIALSATECGAAALVGAVVCFLIISGESATVHGQYGTDVNNEQFAIPFITISFFLNPLAATVSMAIASLISQYAIVGIPVILCYKLGQPSYKWVTPVIGGIIVYGFTFGIVAAIWGTPAAVEGFRLSYIEAGEYVTGSQVIAGDTVPNNRSIFTTPLDWIEELVTLVRPIWLPVTFGTASSIWVLFQRPNRTVVAAVALGILISPALAIRMYDHYWMFFGFPFGIATASFTKHILSEKVQHGCLVD
ncbi:hypothetical protein [Halorubrum ezzemoulense]|uniref:hypothetical protein n=1 Tax=Halorubrum ezzemoulense TaxID=337243 RepID=UPI00117AFA3A|nr:hypothetical protein [Halorubrum ezzemoulense]